MSNAGEPVAPDALGVAAVVVLAAGEGKRMKSALPKVLHRIGGRSLLGHVVAASRTLAPEHLVVVVGHGRDQVVPALATDDPAASTVVQHEQNGTGHAVRIALADLPDLDGVVVVLPGDAPLLTPATLAALVAEHAGVGRPGGPNAATVLSAIVPDPTGYGRIVRAPDGLVTGIVEHRDATPEQRAIAEINSGMYAFDAVLLRDALSRLTTDNTQGEEYLTDVLGILRGDGRPVGAFPAADWQETLGCNDRLQLADLGRRLNTRVLESAMADGVTIVDPGSVRLDVTVTWERDSTLLPGVRLHGSTSVATGAVVGPDCTLTDTSVGAGAVVRSTTADGAEIGPGADVGPYTYLRPGTRLGAKAKAGGFVEMKNAEVGAGSKVPHLSYVGDATIGERTNIGAATVFVNYDGVRKHHTVVGDDVRVGSDSMLVGPVHIGDGAYTAAGSVITEDVPPGAMAVARSRQRNVEGWVERRRPGSPAAEAAARARDAGQSGGGDQSAPGVPTAEGQS